MGSFSATFSRKNITSYTKISPGDMIANIPLGWASYGKRQAFYCNAWQVIFRFCPVYSNSLRGAILCLITLHDTELLQPQWFNPVGSQIRQLLYFISFHSYFSIYLRDWSNRPQYCMLLYIIILLLLLTHLIADLNTFHERCCRAWRPD